MAQAFFYIGPLPVYSRVLLAPMAGVTDAVFRALVRRYAPKSLICTEMISSNSLVYSHRWQSPILDKTQNDHPIAYQLAAHRPEVLIEAADAIIRTRQPDVIDLNMGCPVKKITGNFEGCSLMKAPEQAFSLVQALVTHLRQQGYDTPVTVKFRLGWDSNSMNYREFGLGCQAAGAAAVTLHARTRAQGYRPGCKWEAFGELKQALDIPVIANGDITTVAEAQHVLDTYGVDGVMLGRACQGRPWWVGHLDAALQSGQCPPELSLADRLAVAYEHAQNLVHYKQDEPHAIRMMRTHLPNYLKGFSGASIYRESITRVETLADIQHIFNSILTLAA